MKYFLFSDGASRPNGSHAGAGYVLKDSSGKTIDQGCSYLGEQTNNYAEYQALILGMKLAIKHGIKELVCLMDSNLVASQMNGDFKVKTPSLIPLKRNAQEVAEAFKFIAYEWIPREENEEADALSFQAIENRKNKRSRTEEVFQKYLKT